MTSSTALRHILPYNFWMHISLHPCAHPALLYGFCLQPVTADGSAAIAKTNETPPLAEQLYSSFLDAGAIYLPCDWTVPQVGIPAEDEDALKQLADQSRFLFEHRRPSPEDQCQNDVESPERLTKRSPAVTPYGHSLGPRARGRGLVPDRVVDGPGLNQRPSVRKTAGRRERAGDRLPPFHQRSAAGPE